MDDHDLEFFADLNRAPRPINEVFSIVRARLELSQEQLADMMGISRGTLSDIERGKTRNPQPDTLRRLVDVAAHYGYYLSFDVLLRAARLGYAPSPDYRDIWLESFERFYRGLPDDWQADVRFFVDRLMAVINRALGR